MGFVNVQIMSNNVLKSKNFTVIKHNMFKIHTVLKKSINVDIMTMNQPS